MKKKQLAAMALAAVMLTGCGGGSAAPDATKAADGGAVTTAADAGGKEGGSQKAASGEAVTITLVESLTSPERTAVLRKLRTNIRLSTQILPLTSFPRLWRMRMPRLPRCS